MTLRLRLVAGTLALVTLALALTGVFAIRLLRGYLVDRVDEQLRAVTMMAGQERPPPAGPRPPRMFGLFHRVVIAADGTELRTLAESTESAAPNLPRLTLDDVVKRQLRPFTVDSTTSGGPTWRVVAVPGQDGRSRAVAVSLADVDATVSQLALIVSVAGGGALAVLGLACYLLVRQSLRPLGEIERTAQAIAGGDLARRVPPGDERTEVGKLSQALNGMLTQIEQAVQQRESAATEARRSEELMRRFVTDASHELRTPLTSIRGFAELFRMGEAPDLEEAARLLRRIEDQAARMGLLVDDMLLLARLDQHRPLEEGRVDLLDLAASAVVDAQTLAPDREITLVRLDDEEAVVVGDASRLGQVLGNLVGNALKHTPPGTPFSVAVGVEGEAAVVEVADEGPGFPEEVAEKVFERFYRADPARSPGGTGLGLSIAAALVAAHGGTIGATSSPGKGARFRVTLPRAGRRSPA